MAQVENKSVLDPYPSLILVSDCCVSPSGFFSFSGLCWAQTLIYQMSCCMVVLDTFMLCCTLTKRSALTLWMRTPLQRWDTCHMCFFRLGMHQSNLLHFKSPIDRKIVGIIFNNDKDMSNNVMSRCLLTLSMFCEGILLVYGVVIDTELYWSVQPWTGSLSPISDPAFWGGIGLILMLQIPDLCKSG